MKTLKIEAQWCKGCGLCASFCPRGVLELVDAKAIIKNRTLCIYCGQCELRCPDYAIYLED